MYEFVYWHGAISKVYHLVKIGNKAQIWVQLCYPMCKTGEKIIHVWMCLNMLLKSLQVSGGGDWIWGENCADRGQLIGDFILYTFLDFWVTHQMYYLRKNHMTWMEWQRLWRKVFQREGVAHGIGAWYFQGTERGSGSEQKGGSPEHAL